MSEKPQLDFGIDGFKSSAERVRGERAEREADAKKIIPYGISYLDDYTGGIRRRDFIVLGALTGAGKTSAAVGIAKRAVSDGRRVVFFALEAEPNEIERRLKFRAIVQEVYNSRPVPAWAGELDYNDWYDCKFGSLLDSYEAAADAKVAAEYRNLTTYYRGRDFRAEDIERFFRAVQDQADLIILDHLHYVDYDDDTAENRAIRRIVMVIRDVALEIGIPVLVLAHLRKSPGRGILMPQLGDFHGSSEITKRATCCILMAPAIDVEPTKPYLAPTYIQAAKHRQRGASSLVARHVFHISAREYGKDYELGRINLKGDEFVPIAADKMPRWAKHVAATEAEL